ncbi:hypothetical protein GUJ93_ZPchr0001g30305 [Zizania palustris]|nr:hypothetical protein GUJ93_ZPchr0001g30305 [Zizania palustris]
MRGEGGENRWRRVGRSQQSGTQIREEEGGGNTRGCKSEDKRKDYGGTNQQRKCCQEQVWLGALCPSSSLPFSVDWSPGQMGEGHT